MKALTSVISAAQKEVSPYFEELMSKLIPYSISTESKDEILRAKTIMTIGKLANAVGKEKFMPFLEAISVRIMEDLKNPKLFEMTEAGFSYFADIASILKTDFASTLPTLVPLALKCCLSDKGLEGETRKSSKDNFDLGSDDEDELDTVTLNTSFIDEKSSALYALGSFAISCPKDFLPYMENSINVLEDLSVFLNETIRSQVIQTYAELIESLNLAYYGTETHPKPVMGLPAKVKLAPDAHKIYYEIVLPKYIEYVKDDEDKEVVVTVLESMTDLCNSIGPAIIEERLDRIFEMILSLVKGETACQAEESDEEEESTDDDVVVVENLMTFIQKIAEVGGESIASQMKTVCIAVFDYLKPNRSESDWELGIGCLADVFEFVPSIASEFASKLLPLCYEYCNLEDNHLIWNAAFCIGSIAKACKTVTEPYINEMLQALKNAYEKATIQSAKDNAVSSILKLLVIYPQKLPLELIIPAVFNNIPLNGDYMENINVSKSLMEISLDVFKDDPKYLENYVMTFVKTIVDEDCNTKDDDKVLIGKHLLKLSSIKEIETVLRQIIGKMNQDEVNQLQKYIA